MRDLQEEVINEKKRAYLAAWREKNRGRLLLSKKQWYQQHRQRIRVDRKKKYAIAKDNGLVSGGRFLSEKMGEKYKLGCVLCNEKVGLELDHKIPRSRGGSDEESNLQWLCRLCNFAKGNLTVDEFIAHIKKILRVQNDHS